MRRLMRLSMGNSVKSDLVSPVKLTMHCVLLGSRNAGITAPATTQPEGVNGSDDDCGLRNPLADRAKSAT